MKPTRIALVAIALLGLCVGCQRMRQSRRPLADPPLYSAPESYSSGSSIQSGSSISEGSAPAVRPSFGS